MTTKTMKHVLKASQVQFVGPLQLGLTSDGVPQTGGLSGDATPARIRIAESHAEYALVEVTCSCGRTTYVRCEYAPAQS